MQRLSDLIDQTDAGSAASYLSGLSEPDLASLESKVQSARVLLIQERSRRPPPSPPIPTPVTTTPNA